MLKADVHCNFNAWSALRTWQMFLDANLRYKDTSGYEIKWEAAVPRVEPGNLAVPKYHPLPHVVCRHKGHIPAQNQLNAECYACTSNPTRTHIVHECNIYSFQETLQAIDLTTKLHSRNACMAKVVNAAFVPSIAIETLVLSSKAQNGS